jgi:hypothetical protein
MTSTDTLPAGTTFANGVDGLHAHTNWGETLTIVKRDPQAYGSVRYIVADSEGRRMYAFTAIAY